MSDFWRKNHRLTKLLVFLICLVICGVSVFGYWLLSRMLLTQRTAEVFKGPSEELVGHVSAFFPADKGVSVDSIESFRSGLRDKYTDASLQEPEVGSLYKDCYSGLGTATVKGTKATVSAQVYAIGGEWFYFHPLRLRSGSYIYEADLMHDRICIDEDMAWRLYGGVDLAGMTVTINDKPYIIAGVVAREKDFATVAAGAGSGLIFMNLDQMEGTTITEYEVVGRDPVAGFIRSTAQQYFSAADIVENSERFSPLRIWEVVKSFGKRSMRLSSVIYPYWENAARFVEDILAILLVVAGITAVYPFCYLMGSFVSLVKLIIRGIRYGVPELLDKISERRFKRKERKRAKKAVQ